MPTMGPSIFKPPSPEYIRVYTTGVRGKDLSWSAGPRVHMGPSVKFPTQMTGCSTIQSHSQLEDEGEREESNEVEALEPLEEISRGLKQDGSKSRHMRDSHFQYKKQFKNAQVYNI